MSKRPEKSAGPAEFKSFHPETITPGDNVVFYYDGEWRIGKVGVGGARKEEVGSHVFLDLVGVGGTAGAEIELNVAPKSFKSLAGDNVEINGVNHTILDPHAGPEGEIEYDLENSTTSEIQRNVNHDLLEKMIALESLDRGLTTETTTAMATVTMKNKEVLAKLTGLRAILIDAQKALGNRELWGEFTQAEVKKITDRVGGLEAKLREETDKVREQILAIAGELVKAGDDKAAADSKVAAAESGKKTAEVLLELVNAGMKTLNDLDESVFQDGRAEILATATTPLVSAITGIKDWQTKKDLWDSRDDAYKAEPAHADENPGTKPIKNRLDGTANDEQRKNKILLDRYAALDPVSPLVQEITNRRKAEAAASGLTASTVTAGDYLATSDEYKNSTARIMSVVMEEWKTASAAGIEVPKLNVDTEISELKTKTATLKAELNDANDKNSELRDEMAVIERGIATLDPKGAVTVTEDQLLVFWRGIHDLEVKKLKAEMIVSLEGPEAPERIVNVPAELMRELLTGRHQQYHDLKSTVYDAILNQEPDKADTMTIQVKESVNKFVDYLEPSDDLRNNLRRHGIRDWDVFKKKWHDSLALQVEALVVERASADVRAWAARRIADIRQGLERDPAGFQQRFFSWHGLNQERRDWWEYSQLSEMKLATGFRMGSYVVLLGGTAFGLGFLLKFTSFSDKTKAGMIGGAVGALKVGMQKLMGWDKLGLEKVQERAAKAADQRKKRFIINQLLNRSFENRHPEAGNPNDIRVDGYDARELTLAANGLARIVSRASGTDKLRKEVKITKADGSSESVTLTGNRVLIYEDALASAAMDEHITVEEETGFRFAEKLARIQRQGEAVEVTAEGATRTSATGSAGEKTKKPWDVRLSQGFVKKFTGFVGKDETKKQIAGRVAVTGALGASIALAVNWAVQATDSWTAGLKSTATGVGIGLAVGIGSGYEKELGAVEAASSRMSEELALNIEYYQQEYQTAIIAVPPVPATIGAYRAKYFGYIKVAEAVIANKHLDDRAFNADEDQPFFDGEGGDANQPRDYLRHLKDLVVYADAHPAMKDVLEQMVMDFYRERYREVANRVETNTKDLEKREAENSARVGWGRGGMRYLRALGTAAAYGAVAFVAGAGAYIAQDVIKDLFGSQDPGNEGAGEDGNESGDKEQNAEQAAVDEPKEAEITSRRGAEEGYTKGKIPDIEKFVEPPKFNAGDYAKTTLHLDDKTVGYFDRLTAKFPALNNATSLDRIFQAAHRMSGTDGLVEADRVEHAIGESLGSYVSSAEKVNLVEFEEILKNGDVVQAAEYLQAHGLNSHGQHLMGVKGPADYQKFAEDYKTKVLDAEKPNTALIRKLGQALQHDENRDTASWRNTKGGSMYGEGKRASFGKDALFFGTDLAPEDGVAPEPIMSNVKEGVWINRPAAPAAEAMPGGDSEEMPRSAVAARKLASDINLGKAKIPDSVLPEGGKVTGADWDADHPNMVDLTVVDVSGNIQHHLYRIYGGGGTGPTALRVDPFEVGYAKSASVGSDLGSATRSPNIAYSGPAARVSGGGVGLRTYVINPETPRAASAEVVRPGATRPAVAPDGEKIESGRRGRAEEQPNQTTTDEKRLDPEGTEEVVGDKLRAKDISGLEKSVQVGNMNEYDKGVATNYARFLGWQNKLMGPKGIGIDRLANENGIAQSDNPRAREWLEEIKADWTKRTIDSVKAFQKGLREGISLAELKDNLARAGMVGHENVREDIVYDGNNKNYQAFRNNTIERLKQGFKPIKEQIDQDFVSKGSMNSSKSGSPKK